MIGKVRSIVFGNITSKGLSVMREVLFANWFGTGDTAAAFRIAQTGFLMPTHTFIGDTLSAGLLPLYQKLRQRDGDEHRILLAGAILYGVLFSAITTTALFLYAEFVTSFIAPGATTNALNLAAFLLRILALATPFYVLSGILSYLEAAYGSFGAIAWRPSLLNIGSTLGVGLAAWLDQTHWLATCLLLAHILFFIWSAVTLARLDRLAPQRLPRWSSIASVWGQLLRNMLPLLGLPLIAQSNVLVERMVSSWIGTAVIPAADYARFVTDTIVQLLAVPLGVLTMSKHGGAIMGDKRHHAHVTDIASIIVMLAMPTGIYITLNASSVTRLLFGRGAFDDRSVAVTANILAWMSAALIATVLAYYLVKAMNSQLRNLEALLCTILGSVFNIAVNLVFWRHLGPSTIGIAAATGSGVMVLFAVVRMRLISKLLPLFCWMSIGGIITALLEELALPQLSYPYDLISGAFIAAVIWALLFSTVPMLRKKLSMLFG